MPSHQKTERPLSPELDAIAQAAADRLRAHCGEDPRTAEQHSQRVADAASAAIHAGAALSAIAEAERVGEERARRELRADVLRRVERAAKRKRETVADYDRAIDRAARIGLSHREIAGAASVSHSAVRAVLARTATTTTTNDTATAEPDNGETREKRTAEPLAA
jgi:hypothetical protein